MTVRPIRLFGDPVLRSRTDRVVAFDAALRTLVDDLLDTVQVPGRAGVAANQIGVGLAVFSYNIDGELGYVINPQLVEVRGEAEPVDEGCLSVPGLAYPRLRHTWARVEGVDLDGAPVSVEGEGLLAQALQHETDHLEGRIYVEELEPELKREAMRAIRTADWFQRP